MQPYVEQRPGDIRLSLVKGPFNPEQLTVYASQKGSFFGGRFQVTASIIGASHVLSFPGFHEVFACAQLPDTPCHTLDELEGLPIRRSIRDAQYEFEAKQIKWSHEQPEQLDTLVWLAQTLPFGLICEFEQGTLAVTPITVIVGFLIGIEIPLIMRINEKFARSLSQNIANTWSLDYFGAVVGLAAWILMLKFGVSITNISFCIAALNMAVVIGALWFFWRRNMLRGRINKAVLLSLTIIVGIGTVFGAVHSDVLARSLTQKLYDDPIVAHETTLYQDIVLTKGVHPYDTQDDNYELFLNGNKQFASADERIYHEYLVHPAMEMAASRERVLILGGGDGLALREVLKYDDVQEVTLVDLDPGMIELASTNEILRELNDNAFADARVHNNLDDDSLNAGITPGAVQDVLIDTGEQSVVCDEVAVQGSTSQCVSEPVTETVATVNVLTVDADQFISATPGPYDVIIVDLPDPNSVELAKLYSEEFYSKVSEALSPDGIVTVQATSPYHAKETYLCILRTMTAAGLNVLPYHDNVPSFGDWGWIMASPTLPADELYQRVDTMESFDVPTEMITASGLTRALIFNEGQFESQNDTISTLMDPVIYRYYAHEAWKTN